MIRQMHDVRVCGYLPEAERGPSLFLGYR